MMQRNFLPSFIGIAMSKSQFCFATGCTPYRLKQLLKQKESKYQKLGYHKYDKMLMPVLVRELCADTGLQVDVNYYTQYVAGQRGISSPVSAQ